MNKKQNAEKALKLSIIIVNYNTRRLLKECIDSIIESEQLTTSNKQQAEIIVVDNNSTDGSREYLEKLPRSSRAKLDITSQKRGDIKRKISAKQISDERREIISNITIIKNNRNLGFAKANNQGIEKAKGKYIMLLNSDTIVKKDALKKLVNYLETHPKTAAVSPQLLNKDQTPQIDYYMKFPNLWQIILYHNYLFRLIAMNTPLKFLFASKPKKKPFSVDQLPGAGLMIRKEIVNKVGKLDERFNFFFEDVDWCFRIKNKTDYQLIVVPESKIIHYGGASWEKWREKNRFKFYRQYYLSLLKFIKKNYSSSIFFYQLSLSCTFLINALSHLLVLSGKKSLAQLKLITAVWKKKFDFQLPE